MPTGGNFGGGGGGGAAGVVTVYRSVWSADQLLTPNSADWQTNANAGVVADSLNAAINAARWDDTIAEGKGLEDLIPDSVTQVKIKIRYRAQTAPAGARTVGVTLKYRKEPEGAAISGTWAGAGDGSFVMTDLAVSADAFYRTQSQTILFSAFSPVWVASTDYMFELIRTAPVGGTPLVGDCTVRRVVFEYS
jgi:hypothetical protein